MRRFSQYPRSSQAGLVVGAALVAFGLARFVSMGNGREWWTALLHFAERALDVLWPIALMAVGGVLLWAGMTGRLDGILAGRFNPPLRRSADERRLLGVCGGLAHFCGVNAVIVRVVFVLLLFASPWFCLLAYLILALVMPRD